MTCITHVYILYGKSMCARVGYIQRNEVQYNFVPIVYTYYIQYYTTYLQNCMDLCIIRYAEVNHNITEDYEPNNNLATVN